MSERRYQMIRVKAGDYLLPSNDGETLYRLATYEEDGSGEFMVNGRTRPLVGTYWAVYRHTTPLKSLAPHVLGGGELELLEWGSQWEFLAGPLDTRKRAIEEAIRA